ncbi:hypothetical protein AAC387_Pa05g0933 [Persea americana]
MRFPVLSLLFLFIFSLSFHNPISAQCLDDQKSFLLTLFDSEDNDLSWIPNTDCCSWEGITCDSSTGHVIGLDLTNQSISGSINSTSLISISSLQSLNLSLNNFNCSIPSGLESLSNLTHLNLSFSGFTGLVPIEISRIKSLVLLDLSSSSTPCLFDPLRADCPFSLDGRSPYSLDSPYSLYRHYPYSLDRRNPYSLENPHALFRRDPYSLDRRNPYYLDDPYFLALPSPHFGYLIGNLTGLRELHLDRVRISAPVPEFMVELVNLSSLHLSWCNLSGKFPSKIFHMRNLESLNVSSNPSLTGALPEFPLNNTGRLQIMILSSTQFSGNLPDSFGNLKLLTKLDLGYCNFDGSIPSSMASINQLVHLDLGGNNFTGEIQWLGNLTRLVHLDLSSNNFKGEIQWLGNLTRLVHLNLAYNRLGGQIPFLGSFSQLVHLDLSNNDFSGQIHSLSNLAQLDSLPFSQNRFHGQIPSLANLSRLSILDLSSNNLSGRIPSSLIMIPSLRTIDLSQNQFDGQLDEFHNASVAQYIYLSNNKLQGQIPRSIGQLVGLSILDLSWNNFNEVDLAMLQDLENLLYLGLSNIPLSINSSEWNSSSFPQLSNLFLSSCNLTRFPGFLASLSELEALDLSCNKIDGEIPNWIWTIGNGNLAYLNLSHNLATSLERPPINTLSSSLDFAKNSLSGTLPQSFTDGCMLEMINLNDNQFEGSLPRSLANCKQLEVLNLGNNQIEDSFPFWLGSLPQLKILMLRSNKFYGPVEQGRDDNYFSQMQIIDLSSNGFTGKLSSKFFKSLKAMMVGKPWDPNFGLEVRLNFTIKSGYQESVKIVTKGLELEFSKALSILVSIDLSNNEFEGNIPEEIGNLKLLNVLNMSHNNFTGLIPSSFKNLLQLESLDLSANKLSGAIPVELTSLTFLSVLNLSKNHFVGSIPRGNQFSTFANNSFQENPGLCGPPLVRDCPTVEPPLTSKSAYLQFENKFDWEFIGMGLSLGFGVGIWIIWGPLIFWTNGRRWYYRQMDKLLIKAKAWWER